MNANRVIPVVMAVLCALVAGLAFASAPAFAEKIYYPEVSFGEPGEGPGQLKEPAGVAVNDSTGLEVGAGDVYVVDEGNNRVERFSASGVYLGQFDGSGEYEVEGGVKKSGAKPPTGAFSRPEQVAVDNCTNAMGERCGSVEDPSVGDVYVTDTGHDAIDKFNATGEYLGQLTETKICETEKRHEESFPCPKSKAVAVPFKELRNIVVGPSGELWVYEAENGSEGVYGHGLLLKFSDLGVIEAETSITRGSPFGNHALTVDSHGTVYVGSGIGMYVFSESLRLEREKFEKEAKGNPTKEKEVAERTGNEESFEKSTVGVLALAAVPSAAGALADDLLVDKGGKVYRYGSSEGLCAGGACEEFPGRSVPKGFAGLSESYGLAVNGSGTVYASEKGAGRVQSFEYDPVPAVKTEAPSGVTATEITLHGNVNPEDEEVKACYFEYGTEPGVYQDQAECKPDAAEINKTSLAATVQVSAAVSGLTSADARTARLVAVSEKGVEASGGEVSVSRPKIENATVADVGSSTATATADIDPGGVETCFVVEYGPTTAYGQYTPRQCVGEGQEPVPVKADLAGLQPNSTDHFGVVASNGLGVEASGDVAFSTFAVPSSVLPDGRVDELVSEPPVGQTGEAYVPQGMLAGLDYFGAHGLETPRPFVAGADGEAVTYLGDPPPREGNSRVGLSLGNQFVARHLTGGGWIHVDLEPSAYRNDYVALASDLSVGITQAPSALVTAVPEGYSSLYRRAIGWTPGDAGSFEALLGSFEPTLTTIPEGRSPAEYGSVNEGKATVQVEFGGGNSGSAGVPVDSHLLFEASARLPSAPEAPEVTTLENNLYDSVGGRLYLVNVLPSGRAQPNATFGRQGPSNSGPLSPETSNAISADGSRIFWSAVEAVERVEGPYEGGLAAPGHKRVEERPRALYVRENDTMPEGEGGECEPSRACTVRIDLPESGVRQVGVCASKPKECEHPEFWTATSDGSRVFFTDQQRLTSDATAEAGRPDLYEYDLEAPEGEQLTDLSVPVPSVTGACPLGLPGGGCGQGEVQGVVGVSEDGLYVYFVADGVLSEGANAEGREPVSGEPNLYIRQEDGTTFIATLAVGDGDFTEAYGSNGGDWQADPGHRTAEVTPDGQSVVFMSRRPLTGYDSVVGETSLAEVFVYDADTRRLNCVSCNPSGERPTDDIYPEFAQDIGREHGEHGAGGTNVWGSFVPVSESLDDYQPRVVSEDGGRVFFDSLEPLVPQDKNGFLDVYEWEAPGEGSCTALAASPVTGGCTYLLSGGLDPENSYLVDASASGSNVFFVSRAQLEKGVPGGYDELYDARVGGVVPPEEVRCSGAACQGAPPAPPSFATPPSVTFNGIGNFAPSPPPAAVGKAKSKTTKCRRGFVVRKEVKKKGVCVRSKSKRSKASTTASRAKTERRASR
jgi:hypothetical protein